MCNLPHCPVGNFASGSKEYDLNGLNPFRARQKKWLVQRNKCGRDADCLQKSMADRLEAIENELNIQ